MTYKPLDQSPSSSSDQTPERIGAISDAVVAYMAESMAMPSPLEDQEQNWIFGHMVTLLLQQLDASAQRIATLEQEKLEIQKAHAGALAHQRSLREDIRRRDTTITLWMGRVEDTEADRDALRAALEQIRTDDYGPNGGRIVKGNAELPGDAGDFYRGYNAGISGQFAKASEIATKALAVLVADPPVSPTRKEP